MTARHTGPDRYRTTPTGALTVAAAVLATIAATVGVQAGPRAGLAAAALLLGLPCAAALVLAVLTLLVDLAVSIRCARARRRAGLRRVDVSAIEDQALIALRHQLDAEER